MQRIAAAHLRSPLRSRGAHFNTAGGPLPKRTRRTLRLQHILQRDGSNVATAPSDTAANDGGTHPEGKMEDDGTQICR